MPVTYTPRAKRSTSNLETLSKAAEEEKGKPSVLPTLVRGAAGFGGMTPITGAAFGGGGEILAQMLEKGSIDPRELDPKRVAAATATGALMGKYAKGLGLLVKGGKAKLAALRGATYGGAAPVVQHGVEEGDINPLNYPGEVAKGAAFGGIAGGTVAKVLGPKTPKPPTPPVVKPTATPQTSRDIKKWSVASVKETAKEEARDVKNLHAVEAWRAKNVAEAEKTAKAAQTEKAAKVKARDLKNLQDVKAWRTQKIKAAADAEKAKELARKQAEIETFEAREDVVKTEPGMTRTIKAGDKSLSQRTRVKPPSKEGEGGGSAGSVAPKGPATQKFENKVDAVLKAAEPKGPTQELVPSLQREVLATRNFSKVQAEALRKVVGGEIYEAGPKKWRIRFTPEELNPEPVPIHVTPPRFAAPVATAKDLARDAAPSRTTPQPTSQGPSGLGRESLTPDEFKRYMDLTPMPNVSRTPAELAEYRKLALKRSGRAPIIPDEPVAPLVAPKPNIPKGPPPAAVVPDEPVASLEDMAAVLNKKAGPVGKIKFPTAKLPGKSQVPPAEQADLLAAKPETFAEGGIIPVRLQKKADVEGAGYRATQAAEKAGEIPKTDPFYPLDERGRPITPARAQGKVVAGPTKTKAANPEGPTSDELVKMSPAQQDKAIADLMTRLKKPTGAIDPVLAVKLGMTGAGAGIGATMDEEDRLGGAILGGAAGYGVGAGLGKLPVMLGRSGTGRTIKEITEPVVARIPNYIRGALLSDPRSVGINSIAGPAGSQFWGGLEEMMKGAASGDMSRAAGGLQAVKSVGNIPGWMKQFFASFETAKERLHGVEEVGRAGRFEKIGNRNAWDKAVETPATFMLSGDLTAGKNLLDAGIPEDLMRSYTLTAEPQRALWKGITNFAKTLGSHGEPSNVAKIMAPFVRTAANIMERGTERTPILGSIINYMGNPKLQVSKADQAIQQSIGMLVFGLGFAAGSVTEPEANKALKIRNLVSNLGGPYALLSGAGFAAGQAFKAGKNPADAVFTEMAGSMPLPTTQPLQNIYQTGKKVVSGDIDSVKDVVPDMFIPKFFNFAQEMEEATGLGFGFPSLSGEAAPPTGRITYTPRAQRK